MYQHLFKVFFAFVIILLANSASATVIVKPDTERIMLGKQLFVLQSARELGFSQVLNSTNFKRYDKDVPNLGISEVSTWLRFKVTNQTDLNTLLLEIAYPILDEVELFMPDGQNKYQNLLLGEVNDFGERKYKHPNYIFDLKIPKGESRVCYLRVKSAEQLILPISINQPTGLWHFISTENILTGIFIGAVLIMFLYNLFIYFSVKDISYLYYVIYVASVGLTQTGIKGFTFQYLWPKQPQFELKSVIIFACIGAIAAIVFIRNFLNTRLRARRFDIVLWVIIALLSIAMILTLAGKIQVGFQLMQVSTTLFAISIIIVSVIVMRKGFQPAKYVFFSWSVLLMGAIIFALKDYGILPFNTFTSYSMQGASAIEMALLSFGLANKINILKAEKEASQADALRVAKENERIIREQNIFLEAKVKERTGELEASNNELGKTLEDLKQAQTQLVESEKMASLGQLTAGIAHEINNPINFVTSNVAPLQRDVNILIDTIATMENLSITNETIEDKLKKIEAYKEEIDFDYLKIEISHLMKGISEGASRTAEIVKGLRVFSRLDEDDLKHANLHDGLDSTLVIVNNLLGDIKVRKEYGEIPMIECFPGKLNQVFLNIITNAIQAIKAKFGSSAQGELVISTGQSNEYVFVKVKDNGIGMDEQTVKKVFEPFFTTKEVGEGTGLGMSISYNTIRKHNGQIHIESRPGEGAEFTIELPLVHKLVVT